MDDLFNDILDNIRKHAGCGKKGNDVEAFAEEVSSYLDGLILAFDGGEALSSEFDPLMNRLEAASEAAVSVADGEIDPFERECDQWREFDTGVVSRLPPAARLAVSDAMVEVSMLADVAGLDNDGIAPDQFR